MSKALFKVCNTKQNEKMRKIFLIIITAVLFTNCGIYKKYQRPDVKTDELYRDSVYLADTVSLGNLSWQELFTDSKLQTLIEKGLKNNTDLRIARMRVEDAEVSLKSARLAYIPSFNFAPQAEVNSATKTYSVAVAASWEIDIFGKLTNAKRGAEMVVEQSDSYRQAVQTMLVATIANSYYTLLMLDSQLEISLQTLANWQQNVKVLRALKEAGQANEAAVAQSESTCLSVESSIVELRRQINEIENSISTFLGDTPHGIERGILEEQNFPSDMSVGVPLQMLSNRPDVRQAEFVLAQAYYFVNQARAALYPNITLNGSGGWASSVDDVLFSVVASLTQPIFNNGVNKARLTIAKSEQEQALINFQQSLLDAGAEVNNSLVQWQSAREKIIIDQKQIGFLKSAVNSTRLMMQHGSTNYLEVLVAQQSLLNAELTHVSDKYDEIQGVINLYHALGGGR